MSPTTPPNDAVRELGSTRLQLRGDLVFTPQTAVGEPYCLVEDPLNSRFFRLGRAEYTFVSLLDGRTSIHEALSHLSRVMPHHRLTEHDSANLSRWLVEMDLAHTEQSSRPSPLARRARTIENRNTLARWNPLVFRLPIGRPDRLFEGLARWLGWLHSPLAWLGWFALTMVGLFEVLSNWERFAASSHGVFAPSNWLWLGAVWVVLKIVHETAHGVVCRRYGGTIREAGVQLVLFTPLAYVDVTSSWRFRCRHERIHVAAAGIYIELLIAAIAAIIWSNSEAGWLNYLCFNTIFMASATTLVFNANPLMKFDGYYILSDALAVPNLDGSGRQYLRYWAQRYLLGMHPVLPAWSRRDAVIVRVYGVMSFVWRMLISVCLTITAASLFHGAGIVLSGLAAVLWFGLPAYEFVAFLLFGKSGVRPNRLRFLFTASAAAFLVALLCCVPWPGAREAPAVVEFAPHTVVRALSAGFVREIHVQDGQQIQHGQVLVALENRELMRVSEDLEVQIRISMNRSRMHEKSGKLAEGQAEDKKREALLTQLAEKRAQIVQLTVRAPRSGRIIRRDLAALQGSYLDEGAQILALGDESQKELRVSLSQDDVEVFAKLNDEPVHIDIPRYPSWRGRLKTIDPRASLAPIHPALAATNGGPLPVKSTKRQTSESNPEPYELLTPRFIAVVPLTASVSDQLRSGQRATIAYRPCQESIGAYLYHAVSRWIRERMRETPTERETSSNGSGNAGAC